MEVLLTVVLYELHHALVVVLSVLSFLLDALSLAGLCQQLSILLIHKSRLEESVGLEELTDEGVCIVLLLVNPVEEGGHVARLLNSTGCAPDDSGVSSIQPSGDLQEVSVNGLVPEPLLFRLNSCCLPILHDSEEYGPLASSVELLLAKVLLEIYPLSTDSSPDESLSLERVPRSSCEEDLVGAYEDVVPFLGLVLHVVFNIPLELAHSRREVMSIIDPSVILNEALSLQELEGGELHGSLDERTTVSVVYLEELAHFLDARIIGLLRPKAAQLIVDGPPNVALVVPLSEESCDLVGQEVMTVLVLRSALLHPLPVSADEDAVPSIVTIVVRVVGAESCGICLDGLFFGHVL